MDCGDYTLQKLQLVLAQTSRLLESEFPHPDSKEMLARLKLVFEEDEQIIEQAINFGDRDLKDQSCAEANYHIVKFLPILGFALRSTNTRNAFEFFVPLVRLARKILQRNDAKLILSSEWDYSPFTYPFVFSELPNFVLIGLPASESENPLIIPLGGHELGHSVWKLYDLSAVFTPILETNILDGIRRTWTTFERLFATGGDPAKLGTDLALRPIWSPAREWSRRQLEEAFCDAVGVRLFGESYFYAAEYLLSPHFKNRRSIYYPAIRSRTDAMLQAAKAFGVPQPADFSTRFTETPLRLDAKQQYLLGISDQATAQAIPDSIAAAGTIADKAGISSPVSAEIARIQECFKAGIPAHDLVELADTINAGWKEYIDSFESIPRQSRGERFARLGDILLKTIEVMEFEIRTGAR
jgi:hypothetical protein